MRKYLNSGKSFFYFRFSDGYAYASSLAIRHLERKVKMLEKRTNRAILAVLKEKVGISFIKLCTKMFRALTRTRLDS